MPAPTTAEYLAVLAPLCQFTEAIENLHACAVAKVVVIFDDGREQPYLMPSFRPGRAAPVAPLVPSAAQVTTPGHSDDFRSFTWHGEPYTFTPTQAACIRVLYEAWEDGTPAVSQAAILETAGGTGGRLRDVFRVSGELHPAWGKLITPAGHGLYQLCE